MFLLSPTLSLTHFVCSVAEMAQDLLSSSSPVCAECQGLQSPAGTRAGRERMSKTRTSTPISACPDFPHHLGHVPPPFVTDSIPATNPAGTSDTPRAVCGAGIDAEHVLNTPDICMFTAAHALAKVQLPGHILQPFLGCSPGILKMMFLYLVLLSPQSSPWERRRGPSAVVCAESSVALIDAMPKIEMFACFTPYIPSFTE